MAFKDYLIAIVLVGIFTVALISGIYQGQIENNANTTIGQDPRVNTIWTELNSSVNDANDAANSTRGAFESDNPNFASGFFLLGSLFSAVKTFTGLFVNSFDLIFSFLTQTLGIPSVVVGAFTAILLITLVFLGWRLLKVGE